VIEYIRPIEYTYPSEISGAAFFPEPRKLRFHPIPGFIRNITCQPVFPAKAVEAPEEPGYFGRDPGGYALQRIDKEIRIPLIRPW
jgi:hypothetical protein